MTIEQTTAIGHAALIQTSHTRLSTASRDVIELLMPTVSPNPSPVTASCPHSPVPLTVPRPLVRVKARAPCWIRSTCRLRFLILAHHAATLDRLAAAEDD